MSGLIGLAAVRMIWHGDPLGPNSLSDTMLRAELVPGLAPLDPVPPHQVIEGRAPPEEREVLLGGVVELLHLNSRRGPLLAVSSKPPGCEECHRHDRREDGRPSEQGQQSSGDR